MPAFGISLATLIVTAMNSVAVGLLLSTLVTSAEAAMALTPIALIPAGGAGRLAGAHDHQPDAQVVHVPACPRAGAFRAWSPKSAWPSPTTPAWIIDIKKPDTTSVENFLVAGKFHCAEAQIASADFNGAWGFVDYQAFWLPPAVLGGDDVRALVFILIDLEAPG